VESPDHFKRRTRNIEEVTCKVCLERAEMERRGNQNAASTMAEHVIRALEKYYDYRKTAAYYTRSGSNPSASED